MSKDNDTANLLLNLIGSTQQDVLKNNYISENEKQKNRKRRNEICKIFKMVHGELLTRPPCRRLRPWPNPKFEGPREISLGALTGKVPGNRLEYLAQPKKDEYCEIYFPEKSESVYKNGKERTSINMRRLIKLSKPRPTLEEEMPLEKKRFKNKKEWRSHLKNLQKLAAARRTPQSPLEPKRIKKPLEKILPRINELSQPSVRPLDTNEWTHEELSKMKNLSLKYKPSERIQKLANARILNEETLLNLKYDPQDKVSKATKYKATERIIELSKPIIRNQQKQTDADDKSSAFKVNPRALKAWCSPRIKKLAKPIKRY